ncbi:MAG: TerB family tellurite resistance protein [Leptospiraceae bacterium]|nr:TerB family tellurite resistance protein [Leptospiraceae bacterium]
MFQTLNEKLKSLLKPSNRNPVAKHFREPDYVQDSEERKSQVLFLKLLMAIARKDGHVDPQEFELLQDYAFSNALNEAEWREIQFYAHAKISDAELEEMIQSLVSEVRSGAQKEDFLVAIQDMIEADGMLADEEREIFSTLRSRLEGVETTIFDNTVKSLGKALRKKAPSVADENASLYSLNPVAAVLKQEIRYDGFNHEMMGARLGLMLVLIHSDERVAEPEMQSFIKLTAEQLGRNPEECADLSRRLLTIPAGHFELAHLARLMVENLSEQTRLEWLSALFRMAAADGEYHEEEDRKMRLICRFLLLSTDQFVEARRAAGIKAPG